MKLQMLLIVVLLAGILFSGCTGSSDCKSTADCSKETICLNGTCSYPPVCREKEEPCAISSDCCSGLTCTNYKCS